VRLDLELLLQEPGEPGPGVAVLRGPLGEADHRVDVLAEQGVQQVLTLREAPVHRAHPRAGGPGDVFVSDIQAFGGHELVRRTQQQLTVARGITAQGCRWLAHVSDRTQVE
jgi:hypothetical protein